MMGNGLIATPAAAGSIWPIAAPSPANLLRGPTTWGALERRHRNPGGDPGQDGRRDRVGAGEADEQRPDDDRGEEAS